MHRLAILGARLQVFPWNSDYWIKKN
jgi:hypothetical protein